MEEMFEIQGNGYLAEVNVLYYNHIKAVLDAAPENCYPEEEDFGYEFEVIWHEDDVPYQDIEEDMDNRYEEILKIYLKQESEQY